jgi:hypothetical protein
VTKNKRKMIVVIATYSELLVVSNWNMVNLVNKGSHKVIYVLAFMLHVTQHEKKARITLRRHLSGKSSLEKHSPGEKIYPQANDILLKAY